MTCSDQFSAKCRAVVYLAITNEYDVIGFIQYWLPTAVEVDNAESAEAEGNLVVGEVVLVVRSAVLERGGHASSCFYPITAGTPSDSAHKATTCWRKVETWALQQAFLLKRGNG